MHLHHVDVLEIETFGLVNRHHLHRIFESSARARILRRTLRTHRIAQGMQNFSNISMCRFEELQQTLKEAFEIGETKQPQKTRRFDRLDHGQMPNLFNEIFRAVFGKRMA